MRRLVVVVVVAAVLTGGALAATGDPVERHTAADMAKARAWLLKRTDLGTGWKRLPPDPEDERCDSFHPDQSALVETGQADVSFDGGYAYVGSDVTIYRTEAQARSSWQLNARLAGMQCAVEGLREAAGAGVTIRTVRKVVVPMRRLAPRTVAFQLVARVTGPNGSIDAYFDAVLLGRGRAIAGVISGGIGRRLPVAELRRLAGVVAGRMR